MDGFYERVEAVIIEGRDGEERDIWERFLETDYVGGRAFQIHFIEDDDGGFFEEGGIVGAELGLEDAEIIKGVALFNARGVDDVDEDG